jgi:hypothetical protein
MNVKHFAALSTFIIVVLSLAIVLVVKSIKNDPKPREIGEFEFEGTRTKVYQAGECQVFATKWRTNENPNFFFSCGDRR